jgi:hypothetical protein
MILEAREDIGSLHFHMTRAEKEIRECKEYFLKPNAGLHKVLIALEDQQNNKIATF